MATAPDRDNCSNLRRLLALKRHEQPPPGYFHSFSQQVILRIKDGETGEQPGLIARWFGDNSWVNRLFGSLEVKPAFAGALGLAICGLMLAGAFQGEPEGSSMPLMVTTAQLQELQSTRAGYAHSLPMVHLSTTNGALAHQLRESLFGARVYPASSLLTPAR